MSVLLDTNILLRVSNTLHPMHIAAREAVTILEAHGTEMAIVPQVIYEYWVVATRPVSPSNGLGLTCVQAEQDVDSWCELFRLYLDERGIFRNWSSLVRAYSISGKPAHDARLVAAMQRHNILGVLTFNLADFARFPFIHALSPDDVRNGAKFP
ncbi:MAG: type II toxin-antitoxin system VapC family toxin [Pirellula sp.]